MKQCTQKQFEKRLEQLWKDCRAELSGPFIHSAPAGNLFGGPFSRRVWTLGKRPVLERRWRPDEGLTFWMEGASGE